MRIGLGEDGRQGGGEGGRQDGFEGGRQGGFENGRQDSFENGREFADNAAADGLDLERLGLQVGFRIRPGIVRRRGIDYGGRRGVGVVGVGVDAFGLRRGRS